MKDFELSFESSRKRIVGIHYPEDDTNMKNFKPQKEKKNMNA